VNYDNSLVVTITVTCYSWAPSSGEHLFTCGAIYRPPHMSDFSSQFVSRPQNYIPRPHLGSRPI